MSLRTCQWMIAVIVILLMNGCNETMPPDVTPIAIRAEDLYYERELNATRYDQTYLYQWVTVTGFVERVDSGKVYLSGNYDFGGLSLSGVPTEIQARLNVGDEFTATCKVGDFILFKIRLNHCSN